MSHRILVVDDDAAILKLVCLTLLDHGYDVIEASNGEDALAHAHAVDAIVLDLMLPRLSGQEVFREIRKRGVQVPVLLISGQDGQYVRQIQEELGAEDALLKPFDPLELTRRIVALLP